jgi:predicted nucleic acid-binding protein
MAAYLLDTSAMVAHFRKENMSWRVQELLLDDTAEVYISSLSVAEFARRLLSLGLDSARAREEALNYAGMASRVIPVDTAVAIRAFELGAGATGRLPLADALIAASASTVGATLVHRDARFEALAPGSPERIFLGDA